MCSGRNIDGRLKMEDYLKPLATKHEKEGKNHITIATKTAPATSRNEAWIFLQSEENIMILQFQAFSQNGNGVREI